MSAKRVNCYADYRFQTRIRIPGTNGKLRDATAGEVTGVKLRLSLTETGAAIDGTVGNLAAAENAGDPAVQYVVVDTALLVASVLPIGRGGSFFAIWSKAGDVDMNYTRFLVDDRADISAES